MKMADIKEQGEEWIIVENFIKDKQLYIEEDSIKKAPTYMETRCQDKKKWFLCISGDDLNDVVFLLSKISHYCYGVHEQVEEIADILNMKYEYEQEKEKEKEQKINER